MEVIATYAIFFAATILPLGSPNFRARERATLHLADPTRLDRLVGMCFAGESHGDPEIAARCRILTQQWINRHADELTAAWLPVGWRGWPHAEPIADWQCDMVTVYFDRAVASGFGGQLGDRWRAGPEATRLWVRDHITGRADPELLIRDLCERHQERCRNWGWIVPPDCVFKWEVRGP